MLIAANDGRAGAADLSKSADSDARFEFLTRNRGSESKEDLPEGMCGIQSGIETELKEIENVGLQIIKTQLLVMIEVFTNIAASGREQLTLVRF